jgi:hypothetical protein
MHALLQVTEESLATFFADCGTVMDCRICGDPNSAMRFAFIEFLEEAGAQEVRLLLLLLLLVVSVQQNHLQDSSMLIAVCNQVWWLVTCLQRSVLLA